MIILGRSAAKLETAKSFIGANVKAVVTDVMDEAAIAQAFTEIGRFDHLFFLLKTLPQRHYQRPQWRNSAPP